MKILLLIAWFDSNDKKLVDDTMNKLDVKFDIFIDDGNHYWKSQVETCKNFFPYVRDGGVYVIEDIYPGSPLIYKAGLYLSALRYRLLSA